MDLYIDGDLVGSSTLPAQFCMICLDTSEGCKLYPVNKFNLNLEFHKLTGISLQLQGEVHFVPQFCTECAQRLSNCSKFRDKCLRAYRILQGFVNNHDTVTIQNIRTIDRKENGLASNITKKVYPPDYCDLHSIDIKIRYNAQKKDVKKERIAVEDEPVGVKSEVEIFTTNNMYDNVNRDDIDSKKIQNTVSDLKNDVESKDYDIDIDECDDTDYFNYRTDTDREIKKETKLNKTQVANSRTKINTVKGKTNKMRIKKETRALKKKPQKVKKVTTSESKGIHNEVKTVPKRVRKRKFPPGTKRVSKMKLDLKLIEEIELTQEQQVAEIVKRQESNNYKNSAYKCNFCYKGYYHLEAYNTHMERHTDKFGLFECDVCHLRFKNKPTLRKHMNNHRAIYKCTKCELVSNHRTAMVLHERWHDGKIYKCTHCDEKFTKCTSLMSHVRIKHPSDHVCTQCGFSFIGERGLHLHIKKKHRFADMQKLSGPLCEPCNIRFASGEAYLQHVQASPKHAPDGQLRPNCPHQKKFCKKTSIECEQCGVKLDSVNQYSKHFKSVHPDKTRTQFLKEKVLPSNVMCEKCGKTFTAPVYLRDHMQKHTGVRLYKCDICEKSFMQKSTLTNHIHRHSDNLACAVCHKPFSNAANLQRHMVSHQAVRPYYKCDYCGKSYTSIPGRDLHVAHVHLNVPWPKRVRGKRTRVKARRFSVDTSDSQDDTARHKSSLRL